MTDTWRTRLRWRWKMWWHVHLPSRLNKLHRVLTLPFSIYFLTASPRIHPAYGMTPWRRVKMALRFWWNTTRMTSGMTYRAHLVAAIKLLELPPEVKGCVVECGAFLGAMTANLSIVCNLTGRTLKVYDSFEGLPPPSKHDYWPEHIPYRPGVLKGPLELVRENVTRYGRIGVCEFHKGWFKDTLPHHEGDIAMVVVDVDYHTSLYDCVLHLWPHLVEQGYFFIDEYVYTDYCALFYSEKFWRTRFQCDPPGLIGAGAGVGVGEYYVGPFNELWMNHSPASIAFTRKGWRALWTCYPDEETAG